MPVAIEFDIERLRALIEQERLPQHEVARILGVSRCWVGRTCKRLGLRTRRTGPDSGDTHPGWRGGTRIVKGYRYLYAPADPMATKQGYVAEHRLVVARAIGRALRGREVVHHIDGDSLNNELANLELFATNADHLRHELTGRVPRWSPEGKARMTGRPPRKPTPAP